MAWVTVVLGCSGLVKVVGLLNLGVPRSTRALLGATGRHFPLGWPDSLTSLMHSAAAGPVLDVWVACGTDDPPQAPSASTTGLQADNTTTRRIDLARMAAPYRRYLTAG